jgi:uncharacterized damage-inducible protein DinB
MTIKSLLLRPAEGFTTEIGIYINALAEVRSQLVEAVQSVAQEQLTRRVVPQAHTIGELLLHIGEAEWWWMQHIIGGREMTADDKKTAHWDVLKDPSLFPAYTLNYCLDAIEHIRALTRLKLSTMTDADLESIYSLALGDSVREHNLRWILHHLLDHEAQHKGQILMLKRLL